MTRTSTADRPELAAADAVRNYLNNLFELSIRQGEALCREDFESLENLIDQKADLLRMLDVASEKLRKMGWDLHNPSTYPKEVTSSSALREAADISRKLQAHERYILGQMIAQRQLVGDRLDAILQKRLAVTGYRTHRSHGGIVDAAS